VNENELNVSPQKRVAFYTLGCKLNFAETSMLMHKFSERGYQNVSFLEKADVYIINTCSVTQVADKKCRQAIKKVAKKGARVVVIGCYAQLKPSEISSIEGVDMVLGTSEKFNVVNHVEALFSNDVNKVYASDVSTISSFNASYSLNERTRAFLKIQDGCNYHCSYCTIPLARGSSRNASIADILSQVRLIVSRGIKEIVLTGVNIGDFGRSTDENFFHLIRQLDKVEDIERFRISSIEPNLLTTEIIHFMASSQHFVPHFHIPLQSGCNKILAAMSRRYNRETFASRVNYIKEIMPFAAIGADVIVGFPNESDDNFKETFDFISSLDISYLHVFPFSERPNTKAFSLPNKISPLVKEERCSQLVSLSEQKRKKFYETNIGRKEKVIFESRIKGNLMHGFTSNYIKVEAPYNKNLIGNVTQVEITEVSNDDNCLVNILLAN
jgi:threonylcarbamoyladenosine tRNA methylthiotransferase MtaB